MQLVEKPCLVSFIYVLMFDSTQSQINESLKNYQFVKKLNDSTPPLLLKPWTTYVRHGEIQGRLFKAHFFCILPCLTQSILSVLQRKLPLTYLLGTYSTKNLPPLPSLSSSSEFMGILEALLKGGAGSIDPSAPVTLPLLPGLLRLQGCCLFILY